jgi:hypothetical protein
MRLRHLMENHIDQKRKMGRDLNHLEDLVLFYGHSGADEALKILHDLTDDSHDLSIKWDGKVALFYGRDAGGRFGMGTKGNWAKNNPLHSPEEAFKYITTAGKGEDWRQVMGRDFIEIFPMLEASVPTSFTGFVTGDVIYSPILSPKKHTPEGIQFTPNQVTYTVDPKSDIGQRIDHTSVGIALHQKFSEWNGKDRAVIGNDTVQELNSEQVMTLGQTYAPFAPNLGEDILKQLESLTQRNGRIIDNLLERRQGLSDIPNILYTYNNQSVRSGNKASTENFFAWLPNSKVSVNKQDKLAALHEENPNAFPALFELFNAVAQAKNQIIDQMDDNKTDIQASIGGQRGGEGYVSLKNKVKLVPRDRWRPS